MCYEIKQKQNNGILFECYYKWRVVNVEQRKEEEIFTVVLSFSITAMLYTHTQKRRRRRSIQVHDLINKKIYSVSALQI